MIKKKSPLISTKLQQKKSTHLTCKQGIQASESDLISSDCTSSTCNLITLQIYKKLNELFLKKRREKKQRKLNEQHKKKTILLLQQIAQHHTISPSNKPTLGLIDV
jgi:hypothetical protein